MDIVKRGVFRAPVMEVRTYLAVYQDSKLIQPGTSTARSRRALDIVGVEQRRNPDKRR